MPGKIKQARLSDTEVRELFNLSENEVIDNVDFVFDGIMLEWLLIATITVIPESKDANSNR